MSLGLSCALKALKGTHSDFQHPVFLNLCQQCNCALVEAEKKKEKKGEDGTKNGRHLHTGHVIQIFSIIDAFLLMT